MAKELLRNVYLFKSLSASELDAITRLAVTEKRQGGEFFFNQGDQATALYIVKFGSVQISRTTPTGETVNVSLIATGSHFGEMGFIDGEKRSASAQATEGTEALKIDYKKLAKYIDENPKIAAAVYRSFAAFLCGRLNQTTSDLSFAREKVLKRAS